MNYRHAFHAGNFADVLKHAVLVRILLHLRTKPAAFRVIDTHAGAGRYDLSGPEATRSLEWREGIERLVTSPIGKHARALLAPYLDAIAAFNNPGSLASYPGSPALVRTFLRAQDRLLACEIALEHVPTAKPQRAARRSTRSPRMTTPSSRRRRRWRRPIGIVPSARTTRCHGTSSGAVARTLPT
jgi:23S rRNA (adenine2030-N6)-methyltransferase